MCVSMSSWINGCETAATTAVPQTLDSCWRHRAAGVKAKEGENVPDLSLAALTAVHCGSSAIVAVVRSGIED